MFLDPGTQRRGLAANYTLQEVVERPIDLDAFLILEEVPKILGGAFATERLLKPLAGHRQIGFHGSIVIDGLLEDLAHELGHLKPAQQVVSVIEGVDVMEISRLARKEDACRRFADFPWIDVRYAPDLSSCCADWCCARSCPSSMRPGLNRLQAVHSRRAALWQRNVGWRHHYRNLATPWAPSPTWRRAGSQRSE